MITDVTLKGAVSPRRQLPTGLLGALLRAARTGVTEFEVAICDQLAPARRSNSRVLSYASIPECISAVCHAAPPVGDGFAALTMAPDLADRTLHLPEIIGRQWCGAVRATPIWSSVEFCALDRNDFYRRLGSAHTVIQTLSREPYANIILRINPARSHMLSLIPTEICPVLAEEMSMAGHSNAIAIIPASMAATAAECSPRAVRLRYSCSTPELVEAISKMWIPDRHVQAQDRPLQSALGLFTSSGAPSSSSTSALKGEWREHAQPQMLTRSEFFAELADERLLAVIITEERQGEAPTCFLMKNGISGHDGGI